MQSLTRSLIVKRYTQVISSTARRNVRIHTPFTALNGFRRSSSKSEFETERYTGFMGDNIVKYVLRPISASTRNDLVELVVVLSAIADGSLGGSSVWLL